MKKQDLHFVYLSFLSLFIIGSCSSQLYIASDFTKENEFTSGIEGPASDKNGNIYAVNYKKQGTIGIVTSKGQTSLYVDLSDGSIGNGIRFNSRKNFYVADYKRHNILEVNTSTKKIKIYAHNNLMNQPNDLAIAKNGQLFLSDPNWKESTGNIWRVDTDGSTILLESDLGTTNGIEVSPDESKLYVNESVQRNVWVYDLSSEGNITNKRLFYHFEDYGMDGMRCDTEGNLYITRHGKGTVVILSSVGKLIREIKLRGEKPTNITFGGKNGKTCYVTLMDRGCLESFRTDISGREWAWNQ